MRRLAPAVLLAIAPTLARASDLTEVVTPIAIVGTVFGFSALVIGIVFYGVHRNRRLRHETIRLAIEKGQPLPPDLLDPVSHRDPVLRDLRRGLVLVAVGVGVCLFLGLSEVPGAHRQWAVGFIPGLMGIAYLASWAIARREPKDAPADRG